MAGFIPNDVAGGTTMQHSQASPDTVDFDIILAADSGTGVVSGLAVTPNSSGVNLNVNIAAGTAGINGRKYVLAAVTNLVVGAAHATLPRIDLVVASATAISVVAGTAASIPVLPALPASSAALATVYVPPAATSITAANIVTKAVILTTLPQPSAGRTTTVSIAATETSVVSMNIPANSVAVGSTFRLKAIGLFTNTAVASTSIIRVRFGPTTLTGNIPATVSSANGATARTNIPAMFDAMVTVLTIGASGTVIGTVMPSIGNVVAPILSAANTASVVLNTTVANLVELTFNSGLATTTFQVFSASIVQEV
jgi:hypothetical protein